MKQLGLYGSRVDARKDHNTAAETCGLYGANMGWSWKKMFETLATHSRWYTFFLSFKWHQRDVYDLTSVEPDLSPLWWFQLCVCVFSSKFGRWSALIHIFWSWLGVSTTEVLLYLILKQGQLVGRLGSSYRKICGTSMVFFKHMSLRSDAAVAMILYFIPDQHIW